MYQIGGQPGHRAEELICVLKSIIAKYLGEGKQIIIQSNDLVKFFDKEMIQDAILTSLKRGANTKTCRLWYRLNENQTWNSSQASQACLCQVFGLG